MMLPEEKHRLSLAEYGRSCHGKRRMRSKKLARGYLRVALKKRDIPDADKMGVYHCRACGAWHVGHYRSGAAAAKSRG